MERKWERFIEVNKLDMGEIVDIMKKIDNYIKITDYKLISKGHRNTNYMINTLRNKFFLRICADENLSKNEEAAYKILKEKITMPKLFLAFSQIIKSERKRVMIYEYIDAATLNEYLEKNHRLSEKILKDTAFALSELHNVENSSLENINKIPDLKECFELLIKSPVLIERMGIDLMEKLNAVLKKYKKSIDEKKENFLIHCDFKTSNLLITKDEKIYITDWEYLGYGSRYFDIGLFFRYKAFFNDKERETFFEEYNRNAKIKLDENWVEMGSLHNIASLMELLSREEEAPEKNKDIKELLREEIEELTKK